MQFNEAALRQPRSPVVDTIAQQAEQFDAAQRVPAAILQAMGKEGLLGACVPRQYGGQYYEPHEVGALCEQLGQASASVLSLFTVHTMVSVALARWGTREQKQRWLPRLASGEAIAAFALSEPQAGSDVQGVSTTFAAHEDVLLVSGVKQWISFGQVADVFLVVGKYAGKLTAVLIERDTSGLCIEPINDMLGFRAAMLARVTLQDCVVPRSNLVGSVDFGLSQIVGSVLDHGRYCIAFGGLGLAQASLDASRRYAQQRIQFDRPLAEHPLIQQLLAEMIVNVRAARLLCEDASRTRTARSADMIMSTVVAKYFAARTAEQAASVAVQIHGANGCSARYPVQRYLRDSKILQIIEGSAQMQQLLIAQHGGTFSPVIK